jgi:hypothetical protein
MNLRGQDVEDGLRELIKAELKEGPKQAYDLGKPFFLQALDGHASSQRPRSQFLVIDTL